MARTKTTDLDFLENHFKKIYDFEKLLIKTGIEKKSISEAIGIEIWILKYTLQEYNQDFDYEKLLEVQDFILKNEKEFCGTFKENNEIFLYLWENKQL